MIKKDFRTKTEAQLYLDMRKSDMLKGYLTRSEREELKLYLDKPESLISKEKIIRNALPIIYDRTILSQPSEKVTTEDDINYIVQSLKDALYGKPGAVGLSAPQIGIKKRICYISIPSINKEKKTIEYNNIVLINPVIIEKSNPIRVNGEGCVSFPGIRVDTLRYIFCTVEYLDESLNPQVDAVQDLESFAIQHEVDHLNGILLFDRKWRTK